MSVLAVIRPDSWFFPLFLHIAGSMVLVGALALASISLIAAWRSGSAALIRLAYLSLFYGALPGYIVFRIGAEWIAEQGGSDELRSHLDRDRLRRQRPRRPPVARSPW